MPHREKARQRLEKIEKHTHQSEHVYRLILHLLERTIASICIVVLVIALILQICAMFGLDIAALPVDLSHFTDMNTYLHDITTVVVGLEFVRMLIDTTPANILEVLTLAITRHVVLSHDDFWSNLVSIVCIAILFAIRRYLVRRNELKEELVEIE
jgi:hypothetical protein